MKALRKITIAQGVSIKKGTDVEMNGDGSLTITTVEGNSYVWAINTYDILNRIRKQHKLGPI